MAADPNFPPSKLNVGFKCNLEHQAPNHFVIHTAVSSEYLTRKAAYRPLVKLFLVQPHCTFKLSYVPALLIIILNEFFVLSFKLGGVFEGKFKSAFKFAVSS